MTIKRLPPMDYRTAITDQHGRPSPEFQRRWALQLENNDQIPQDFTDLQDVPQTYTGAANELLNVKSTEDGIEFITRASLTANPTAVAGDIAINGSASTFMRSDAATAIQKGSASAFGIVKVDNSNIVASSGVINLNTTSVTPGAYTNANITVDAYGRITLAASGSSGAVTSVASADGSITVTNPTSTVDLAVVKAPKWTTARTLSFTGDATGSMSVDGSAAASAALTLAASGVSAGSYTNANITVDAKGRVTVASNGSSGTGTVSSVASADGSINVTNPTTTVDLAIVKAPKLTTARSIAMSGDVVWSTSFDGSGNVTAAGTIQNSAVTLAKIANAAANTRFLGSGSAGSGSAYAEQTITAGSGVAITAGASGITITATGASVPATALSPPQGRLTLVTGTPVMTSDQTAKTHIYYTPYVGAVVPVYSGSAWSLTTLSADLDMALDSTNQPASQLFDLFCWNSGAAIGAGPAWSNTATITVTIATPAVVSWTAHGLPEGSPVIFTTSGALPTGITAGTVYYVGRSPGANSFNISTSVANAAAGTFVATSGSQSGTHTGTNHTSIRGTGAGTTELQMLNGIWTNKNSITLTNGAGAGTSVGANQATYLGTFYTTAAGQTGVAYAPAYASGGANPVIGLYNAYNRVPMACSQGDSTSGWTVTGATWQALNTSTGNRISWVDGLGQSSVRFRISAYSTGGNPAFGVSIDSTTATPTPWTMAILNAAQGHWTNMFTPQLGFHYGQGMQAAATGNPGSILFGYNTAPFIHLGVMEIELQV